MKDLYNESYHVYDHDRNDQSPLADKTRQRLKSQKGESLAEVLIALLISSIALTMLAAMISAAASMVKTGQKVTSQYVSEGNKLATLNSGTAYNGNITFSIVTDDGSGTLDSSPCKVTDDSNNTIAATYYTNNKIGNKKVTAYKKE